ncbi:hypothetical protein AAMO2058_000063100 [Amorphochlora amoebiformis]
MSKTLTTVRLMSPDDANPAGNVHGGSIMKMIEMSGYVAAMRHLNSSKSTGFVVTYRLEHMDFLRPMFIGTLAKLNARVVFIKDSDILVEVIVKAEDVFLNKESLTNKAFVWYTAFESLEHPKKNTDLKELKRASVSGESIQVSDLESKMFVAMHSQMESDRRPKNSKSEAEKKDGGEKNMMLTPQPSKPDEKALPPSASASDLMQIILPSDCTSFGLAYGGVLMKLMDNSAGLVSVRHCRSNVVTACVDAIDFLQPVLLGDLVKVSGRGTFASSRSLEVQVLVHIESTRFKGIRLAARGLYTFVSLGKDGKPQPLPPILPQTEDEKHEFGRGLARYLKRRAARKALSAAKKQKNCKK